MNPERSEILGSFACDKCEESFNSELRLLSHSLNSHEERTPKKGTPSSGIPSSGGSKERKCVRCGILKDLIDFYPTKYTCKECIRIKEICSICGILVSRTNMKQHHDFKHSLDSKYKEKIPCPGCNRSYSRKYLNNHKKICLVIPIIPIMSVSRN